MNRTPEQLMDFWGFDMVEHVEVWAMAQLYSSAYGKKSGALLAELGLADSVALASLDALLAEKPSNVLTLEYLSDKIPGVRKDLQKLLAINFGYPYFKKLDVCELHSALDNDKIQVRCNELNAVLYRSPLGRPLLVFYDYNDLTRFTGAGRIDRMRDPLRLEFGDSLVLCLMDPGGLSRDNVGGDVVSSVVVKSRVDREDFWSNTLAQTDAERILAKLLDTAILSRSTDIAFEPLLDGTVTVQIRVFGDLVASPRNSVLTVDQAREIIRFLAAKTGAGDGARLRKPVSGSMTYKNATSEVFIRSSFMPTSNKLGGEDIDLISVSLRILPKSSKPIYLEDLNLGGVVVSEAVQALLKPQGLILVAGPTNSGKSTTLAGLVGQHMKMYGLSKKRISVEDPVERYLGQGITQIEVKDNFSELMRQLLRHDPDVLWVGEIRDTQSASTCIRAATSGHLSLSSIHANDTILAFKAVSNYLKENTQDSTLVSASAFDLAESLSLILGQRLIKRLCSHCSEEYSLSDEAFARLKTYVLHEAVSCSDEKLRGLLEKKLRRAHGGGCEHCKLGYSGEVPINEVLPFTRDVKNLVLRDVSAIPYGEVSRHRSITLFESALDLVLQGVAEVDSLFI